MSLGAHFVYLYGVTTGVSDDVFVLSWVVVVVSAVVVVFSVVGVLWSVGVVAPCPPVDPSVLVFVGVTAVAPVTPL